MENDKGGIYFFYFRNPFVADCRSHGYDLNRGDSMFCGKMGVVAKEVREIRATSHGRGLDKSQIIQQCSFRRRVSWRSYLCTKCASKEGFGIEG